MAGSLSVVGGGGAVKLDLVAGANKNGGGVNRQNSLSKIAKFKPMQLKNFSSKITSNIAKNKEASKTRTAQQNLVKAKVQSFRAKSPLAQKSPLEAGKGIKVNIST